VIEHDGVPVGRIGGEPIVDQRTFERLRAMFAGRKPGRTPGQVYVATGVLRCGKCGTKLSGTPHSGKFYPDGVARASYFCAPIRRGCGEVYADVRQVDGQLKAFVVSRLSDSRHAAAVAAARSQVADRLTAVNTEIAECEVLQSGLSERLGARKMTLGSFDQANEPLVADLARLYAEREALSGGDPDGPTEVQSADTVAGQWKVGGVADKRAMFVNALGRDRLVIDPYNGLFANGKRAFDPSRIRLIDAQDAPVPGGYERPSRTA
jgi:hypothetical protein